LEGGEVLRSALQGVKVVDLCIVLAGPTCGRTLAEFGADVIKIDSPHTRTVLRHNDINRGKRSILIDLKTKEGLEIFWKLVDEADVVLQNFRSGVAEKLGIDYARVHARRPGIVYGSMNTFGHVGPYAGRPGHEQIGQAVSGMQVRFGSNKPATAPFAANDYGTGLMACYGVALALLHKRRTGEGQFVDSALAYTATMLQSALLQDYKGKEWNEPHGQDATGSGPLNRLYQGADGWLFLAASERELAHCAEFADLSGRSGADLERELETRMRSRNVAVWVDALNKAGIGAHRVVPTLPDLMTDPLTVARGLAVTREHEGFGLITTTAPGVKLSRTPMTIGAPASKPGKDIRERARGNRHGPGTRSSDQRACNLRRRREGRVLSHHVNGAAMTRLPRALTFISVLVAGVHCATGYAQPYPARTVRVIVTYAPGGGSDILGRMIGAKAGEELGQLFVIDNRPGGNATIGTQMIARAVPRWLHHRRDRYRADDEPGLFTKLPYDAAKDFRADHADRVVAADADGASIGAGQERAGTHRAGEIAPRPANIRLRGRRHRAASRAGIIQGRRRYRRNPRAV
jgi:crotonobetainyl-CoA:carnitine CoA-transferase CaiB-like acyl-CoA transferase